MSKRAGLRVFFHTVEVEGVVIVSRRRCVVCAGVEHLLRDVKDSTISTLASEVSSKLASLKGLEERLREISGYMDKVAEGKLPMNNDIMYHLQDVFNLLPNLNVNQLVKSFAVKTNDMLAVVYLAALIRSIIALHTLINNKVGQGRLTGGRCHVICWYQSGKVERNMDGLKSNRVAYVLFRLSYILGGRVDAGEEQRA